MKLIGEIVSFPWWVWNPFVVCADAVNFEMIPKSRARASKVEFRQLKNDIEG